MKLLLVLSFTITFSSLAQDTIAYSDTVSYANDIHPIIKQWCIRCHEKDDENPSNFAMDTYQLMRTSGTTKNIIVPGNAEESYLIKKLQPHPPKGSQMPMFSKKHLSKENVDLIKKWIDQGAKNN